MNSDTDESRFAAGKTGSLVLGVLYVLVGISLVVSLVTDWFALFVAVLVGILALVVVSLAVLVRAEGLVTAENKLIGVFVLLAMVVLFALFGFTDLPFEVVFGIVLVVGVLVPHLLRTYTGYGGTS